MNNQVLSNEVEFILNDNNENEKTKQFVNLLAFGSFANPEKVRFDELYERWKVGLQRYHFLK